MGGVLVVVGLGLVALGVVLIWQGRAVSGVLPLVLGVFVLLIGARLKSVKSAGFSPTRGFTIDFREITRDIRKVFGRF